MRARIHRGSREVGGSCVELEAEGERLVIDLGRPLDTELNDDVPLPAIAGLAGRDPSLLGVVISHGHSDHWGLVTDTHPDVPLFMGRTTERILREAAFFSSAGAELRAAAHLQSTRTVSLGPFDVTPYCVDHSAFDAYALLIEAGGRRLFYSGDLRAKGFQGELFEELIRRPPAADAVLLEGTQVHPGARRHSQLSEREVESTCAELFAQTEGMVLAAYSVQNIGRMVSLYRAAKQAGRRLVLDLYGASIAAAAGIETIPYAEWDGATVFVPLSQRIKVKRTREFHRVRAVGGSRVFRNELAARRGELVLTFRYSMARELEHAECLHGARAVWSLWEGYLHQPSGRQLRGWLRKHGIPLERIHASGHATVPDLQRLAEALWPARIVPIHTAHPELFPDLFPRCELHSDGEWWTV